MTERRSIDLSEGASAFQSYSVGGTSVYVSVSENEAFHPRPASLMLAEALEVRQDEHLLDVGTGSGILAIAAARKGARFVLASDISGSSLLTAKRNAIGNGVSDRLHFVQADMLRTFEKETFEVIVSNPPCMPVGGDLSLPRVLRVAVDGGEDGSEATVRFLSEAVRCLKPTGRLYVPVAKWSNWARVMEELDRRYRWKVIGQESVRFWLADVSSLAAQALDRLVVQGKAHVTRREESAYSEVLACEARPRT